MNLFFKKTINYVVVILLIAISVSCISTQSLIIEIPQKGKEELPFDIQSLTIVARTIDTKYTDINKDSIQQAFYKARFNLDTVIYDIQTVDTTLKALGELLFESGRFDFVIPENRFLDFEENAFLTREMPWDEVSRLCNLYQTDAVLSLDHFATRVSTEFRIDRQFSVNQGYLDLSVAIMQVYYETLFRVYDPVKEQVILREFQRDTLTWEETDFSTKDLFKRFTPVKQAITEAGISAALEFADKIGTSWRTERRQYFAKGSKALKDANLFVNSENWQAAMEIWGKTAEESSSKSLKSKSLLNIALGHELLGDIDQAIIWALKSYDSMYRLVTYEYLETLKNRKSELQKQLK